MPHHRSVCVQAPVAAVVGRVWDVFQPLLFGLIGAEINISSLSAYTVGPSQNLTETHIV